MSQSSVEAEFGLKNLGNRLLQNGLSRIRWKLKQTAQRRLAIDIAALCTGLRNVVMMDYAFGSTQLKHNLFDILKILAEEIQEISSLKLMILDDVTYIIHPANLITYMDETLTQKVKLQFVILDGSAARFATSTEKKIILKNYANFKDHIISHLCLGAQMCNGDGEDQCRSKDSIGVIDLADTLEKFEAALPTLNGWLLGYPVIYSFEKENVSKAVRILSSSSLHRYSLKAGSDIFTSQAVQSQENRMQPFLHEVSSFTLPSELSLQGPNEEWARSFLSVMKTKIKDSWFWSSLELQVTMETCQSIAL